MKSGDAGVDLLLVFQATFADSTLVTSLVDGFNSRGVTSPVFLWAVPEPRTGGRLRLNSLCGINLAGHALNQRQQGYEYAYAQPDDPEVITQIKALAGAGMLRRRLAQARVGVVGEHPDGMDSCHLDEEQLKKPWASMSSAYRLNMFFPCPARLRLSRWLRFVSGWMHALTTWLNWSKNRSSGTLSVYQALRYAFRATAAIRNSGALLA